MTTYPSNSEADRVIQIMLSCPGLSTQADLAKKLGIDRGVLQQWRVRGKVPLKYLPKMVVLARKHGKKIRLEDLDPAYKGVK